MRGNGRMTESSRTLTPSLVLSDTDIPCHNRHGRDHLLQVWQFRDEDVGSLDQRLPAEARHQGPEREPWLLHSIPVNSLNFCAFGMCHVPISLDADTTSNQVSRPTSPTEPKFIEQQMADSILIASPNALDSGGVDVFLLPAEKRLTTLINDKGTNLGMVMAVAPFFNHSGHLVLIAGYESGHTTVHLGQPMLDGSQPWRWTRTYLYQPHSQPLLFLSVSPSQDFYLTCSADAVIAKHPIPTSPGLSTPLRVTNTKHAGQQGLQVRSDGKIFATAGWDAKNRVYSARTMRELAVLKWHREGCYTVAFGDVLGAFDGNLERKRAEEQLQDSSAISELQASKDVSSLETIRDTRIRKAKKTHWLAAGGKDGKISMWDIY